MIRRFRFKFIRIVLTTVFVILMTFGLILNLSVISGTYYNYDRGIDDFYEFLAADPCLFGDNEADVGYSNDKYLFFIRKPAGQDFLEYDLQNITDIPADAAYSMAESALDSGNRHGIVDIYRYGSYTDDYGNQTIVFNNVEANIEFLEDMQITTLLSALIILIITIALTIPISYSVTGIISDQLNSQNEFITNASHDLKTPIAVISANMDVLSLSNKDNQWVESTKKQVKYLKKLVNNIIITSKLHEQGFSTPFENFDLSHATHNIANIFTELANTMSICFTAKIEPDIIFYGSEFYYRQMISILCENAVKYTVKNGKVDISLNKHKGNIYFTISNTRDPEDVLEMDKLFNRFYRGDKSRSTDKYGNGLGLSMAKSICEMHNGSITAFCKSDDSITFSVILKG